MIVAAPDYFAVACDKCEAFAQGNESDEANQNSFCDARSAIRFLRSMAKFQAGRYRETGQHCCPLRNSAATAIDKFEPRDRSSCLWQNSTRYVSSIYKLRLSRHDTISDRSGFFGRAAQNKLGCGVV
jgi:hypothetical protein